MVFLIILIPLRFVVNMAMVFLAFAIFQHHHFLFKIALCFSPTTRLAVRLTLLHPYSISQHLSVLTNDYLSPRLLVAFLRTWIKPVCRSVIDLSLRQAEVEQWDFFLPLSVYFHLQLYLIKF